MVVAAVIRGDDGRVLLARRPRGSHLAGCWEFPGGRVEDGELAEDALVRELAEELGVDVEVGEPDTFAWHHDSQREVLILFYRASIVRGLPEGREGQDVGWFPVQALAELETPPADAALVRRLIESESS